MTYKAFVSSTYEDLKDHRRFVIDALRNSAIHVDPMENWTAATNEPRKFAQQRIEGCDLCVLLVAFRRGHVPKGGKLSITQLEYRKAKSLGIDILPFLLDEEAPWNRRFDELDRDSELRRWREELQEHKGVGFFGLNPDSIQIQPALARWLQSKQSQEQHPQPVETTSAEASPPDVERYLRSLWKESAFIDIRGLQVGESRAFRFPIEDLYITLTTAHARERTEAKDPKPDKSKSPSLESRSLPLQNALSNKRLVIIGDPGSGKTTFLRRGAAALCLSRLGDEPGAAQQRLGVEGRPFPIFVRLAELSDCISLYRKAPDSAAPKTVDAARWLPYFLARQCEDSETGLDETFFSSLLKDGQASILLDGLDEVADIAKRTRISKLVENLSQVYRDCPIVVTTRPQAYRDEVVLPDFEHVRIDPLEPEAVRTFLRRWCEALFPENPKKGKQHRVELLKALERPDIRLMTANPVMLTALAVVHWNERILPEQRADLYASIIKWLARSRDREGRPERPKADRAVALLEELALAMQLHPEGRQTQVDKHWAADSIAGEWPEERAKSRIGAAQNFLEEEELDSGIVIGRGNQTRFWHLTFQEYLAARAIAGRTEVDQRKILFQDRRLHLPEWREVVLLFTGTLHQGGKRRLDGFVSAMIDQLGEKASLADRARCVGLLGQILRDLEPLDYRIADGRYQELLDSVMAIFDEAGSRTVRVEERREAAEALGQAGDPRLHPRRQDRFVTIPAGSFSMGAQSEHKDRPNYDADAYLDEVPVHEVTLDSFEIGRYPVTVQEYQDFINAKGYEQAGFWKQGGFGEHESPEDWDDQLAFPNRPVVGVSWYEAAAYCLWAGARLPTEAEWEYAARGKEGRRYPWGDEPVNSERLNFDESGINRPTPVGIYPLGANPEGIRDMAGNVWEWVADWYGPYKARKSKNPQGPTKPSGDRVIRGGGFSDSAGGARAADRYWDGPGDWSRYLGFRVVRAPAPQSLE